MRNETRNQYYDFKVLAGLVPGLVIILVPASKPRAMEDVSTYLTSGDYPINCSENEKRRIRKQAKSFMYDDGKLFRMKCLKTGEIIKTLCIENHEEKVKILEECHDRNGHKGIVSTLQLVGSRYYWPNWTLFVKDYCLSCEHCHQGKDWHPVPVKDDLHPIPVKDDLWSQWEIDFVGPLEETSSGNNYIIAATDYFSKWPEAAAVPNNNAVTTATFLYGLYCRYGAADILISDCGPHFCNKVMEEMDKLFGVEHRVSTSYHAEMNGFQERTNQTIENSLRKLTPSDSTDWDIHLDTTLFGIRQAVSKSTLMTPYNIAFGKEPKLPFQLKTESPSDVTAATASVEDRSTSFRQSIHQEAKSNIDPSHQKMKERHVRKRQRQKISVGDIVGRVKVIRVNQRDGAKMSDT